MDCNARCDEGDGSDRSEGHEGPRYFDHSAVGWLAGEAVRHLHGEGKEAELAYRRAIELLRRQDDASQEVTRIAASVRRDDTDMRWSLLHVLGDMADARSAGYLFETAVARLPDHDPAMGCEGPRDNEVLVATMAVEALHGVAAAHKDVADLVLKLVSARPARPILVEGVKAAVALGLRDRVKEMLSQEDNWMLDLRRARAEELRAEPERQDGKERGFTPPRSADQLTGPRTCGCHSPRK